MKKPKKKKKKKKNGLVKKPEPFQILTKNPQIHINIIPKAWQFSCHWVFIELKGGLMVFKMSSDGDPHVLAASFWALELCPLEAEIVELLVSKGSSSLYVRF